MNRQGWTVFILLGLAVLPHLGRDWWTWGLAVAAIALAMIPPRKHP